MSLADEQDHGGVTDEAMEQFFADHPDLKPLGQTAPPVDVPPDVPPEPQPEPEPEPHTAPPEGEPETAPDTATPEPSPESPDDFVELDGTRYPRSQVSAAAEFQRHLTGDPQLQRLITDYLTGQSVQPTQTVTTPSEPAEPAQPPADLDLDDPSVRALYNLVRDQQTYINEQIGQLSQGLRTTYDSSMAAQRNQIDGQWRVASAAFAKDHALDQGEVENLGQVAARLGVLPQLMQGVDPITGAPSQPDPIRAFDRALEIALYMVPEYRDKEFRRSVSTMQQEAQKRKLLGAVGGSSGSVTRTTAPPQPGSPEAKRAMLAEVGSMLNGDWNEPN